MAGLWLVTRTSQLPGGGTTTGGKSRLLQWSIHFANLEVFLLNLAAATLTASWLVIYTSPVPAAGNLSLVVYKAAVCASCTRSPQILQIWDDGVQDAHTAALCTSAEYSSIKPDRSRACHMHLSADVSTILSH